MFSHPIVKDMERWWGEHGGIHDDPAWLGFLSDFSSLAARKFDEQRREHSNDGRFGMSKAGGCTRAAILKLRGAEAEAPTGSDHVTFWHGHMAEVLGIATLRALKLSVSPSTDDGEQWETRIDPFMLSTSDGVILPNDKWPTRTLLSVKSGGYKMSGKTRDGWKRYGFAQFPFDGVRRTNPNYWAQLQAEMHGAGFKQALFVLVAKDLIKVMKDDPYLGPQGNGSLSFYAELVPYDARFCASALLPTWAVAWQEYNAGEIGTALALSKDGGYVTLDPADADGNKKRTGLFNFCDYCAYRDACESSLMTGKLAASIEMAAQA